MSPAARPLLALAACAALLAACAANHPRPRAGAATQCATGTAGTLEGTLIQLPRTYINPRQKNAEIEIPDNCALRSLRLRGQTVKVCDDVAPVIQMPPLGLFTPVIVYRLGQSTDYAVVDVNQYCEV